MMQVLVYGLVWIIINVGPMWYTIYANKDAKYIPARDDKYREFARTDYDKWSYVNAVWTNFFWLPRFLFGQFVFCFAALLFNIVCIGEDPYNLRGWKKTFIEVWSTTFIHLVYPCAGIFARRVRVDIDYSKYLGKDYEKTYDGAGIHVVNHVSAIDPVMIYAKMTPRVGFLAKKEALNIPGCAAFIAPLDMMTVGREKKDSQEDRERLIQQILERAEAGERGEIAPLCIYPEGATSNGKGILKFKRGAFVSLRAVKPHFTKCWTLTGV